MPAFNITLSETIATTDVFADPFSWGMTINGVDYTPFYVDISVKERLNEPTYFTISFFNLSATDKTTNIVEGKRVKLTIGGERVVEGEIEDVINETDEITKISCMDMSITLRKRGFQEASPTAGYYRKTGTAINTIVNEIRSSNLNGSSPFIINAGINDQTTGINFRAENTDRLTAIMHLARTNDKEWWVDQDGSGVDRLNFTLTKGSGTSVRSYTTSGASQNVWVTNREVDKSELWNRVVVVGFGDGTNQIRSVANNVASQTTYGIIEKVITDRRIKTTAEGNFLALKILEDHKDPINRISLEIDDDTEVIETIRKTEVGDTVTITDPDTNLTSSLFRIVERQIDITDTDELMIITLANKRYSYIEQIASGEEITEGGFNYQQINDPTHNHGQTISDPTHTHGVTGATSDSSDTAEYFNQFITMITPGGSKACSPGDPAFITGGVPSPASGTFNGCLVATQIVNSTGSTQTHNWEVINDSTATTLATGTYTNLADLSGSITNHTFSSAQVSVGHTLRFKITSGTVGTLSGRFFPLGYFQMTIQTKTTHDHTVSGQTGIASLTGITGGGSPNVGNSTSLTG